MNDLEVNLIPKRVFCDFHARPFIPEWPRGVDYFMTRVWNLASNTIPPYNGSESLDDWTRGHCRWVEKHLDEKPLCCRLEKANLPNLIELYCAVPSFRVNLCAYCKRLEAGASLPIYRAFKSHVCFACYLDRHKLLDRS